MIMWVSIPLVSAAKLLKSTTYFVILLSPENFPSLSVDFSLSKLIVYYLVVFVSHPVK